MRSLLLVGPFLCLITLCLTAEPALQQAAHTVNWHAAFFGF